VSRYYTQSLPGYRWLHSTAGSIHMALNPDGRFARSGYYGQVRCIEAMIAPDPAGLTVLELGSGLGFNALYLADRWPTSRITGIDLTPMNVLAAKLKSRKQPRVTFQQGDFHHLPFTDGSFDLVFSIESLCHATDLRQVLGEAIRVMRPSARLVVFDGYRQAGFEGLDPQVKQAARLTEAAMAVDHSWIIDDWLGVARDVGFRVIDCHDLTREIMPNLQRLSGWRGGFSTRLSAGSSGPCCPLG
jgi:SAM-dependent methyltransferase